MLDDNLPSDIKTAEGAPFDDVARIVGFPWINRENFIIVHIHLGTKEIQEHEPGSHKSFLVNAGEEACQILVDKNEVSIDRRFAKNGQQSVHIPCGKVIWTGGWDELKDEPSKDVEHRSKGRIHEGDDGSTAPKIFLAFGQDVSGWKLSARANCPRISLSMLAMKGFDQ